MIWKSTCSNELYHYASPYYDPAKAHEYYMRTRELKGRSSKPSRPTLNEEGTIAKKLVTEAVAKERQEKIAKSQENKQKSIQSSSKQSSEEIKKDAEQAAKRKEAARKDVTAFAEKAKNQIASLAARAQSGNLSQQDRESLRKEIVALRESTAKKRANMALIYKRNVESIDYEHKKNALASQKEHSKRSRFYSDLHKLNVERAHADYERTLESETDKIYNTDRFTKKK